MTLRAIQKTFAPLTIAVLLLVPALSAKASAAACDKVNIIYCGVTSIDNFKNIYASNDSGHSSSPTVKKNYHDLHAIYAAQGITATDVKGMSTTNTKLGRVYQDGTVKVAGKTVGTNAKVSARFSVPGATPIAGTNAFIRPVTSSFANASEPAYVRTNSVGTMMFAVITTCGNGVSATPMPPTPAPTPTPTPTPPTPAPVTNVETTVIQEQTVVTAAAPVTPVPAPAPVVVATAPVELVKTGPGNIIAIFIAATLAGATAYSVSLRKKLTS